MKNALILHGTASNSKDNWFPWLKNELEKQGYHVWLPDLPHADKPNPERYNNFLLTNPSSGKASDEGGRKGFIFTKDTILIGHSSGAVEILHLLPQLSVNIRAAFLVGAFKDNYFLKWEPNDELFSLPFNFEAIRKHCKKLVFIHSEDDPFCPLTHASYLTTKTGGELVIIPHQKHFSVSTMGEKYREFPELLERIIAL